MSYIKSSASYVIETGNKTLPVNFKDVCLTCICPAIADESPTPGRPPIMT